MTTKQTKNSKQNKNGKGRQILTVSISKRKYPRLCAYLNMTPEQRAQLYTEDILLVSQEWKKLEVEVIPIP